MNEIQNRSLNNEGRTKKLHDFHTQKLKSLEAQISDFMKKQENQVQLLKSKEKSQEAAKCLQQEMQFTKAQKLRKDGWRNEYEKLKLQALNQRQKLVLQRKTNEAAMATERLKELLESEKVFYARSRCFKRK
uniref:Uncharacterized protein n=1 Tax=Kalanchoe fedtschenkoi TaxID=63787 RepID=A0A7N0TQ92_KALFE